MIFSLLFGILFFLMAGVIWFNLRTTDKGDDSRIPSPLPTTAPIDQTSRFIGTVQTGAQIEEKNYCPNGLYLVADEGTYLVNQTKILLLRLLSQPDGTIMLSDQKYLGKKVEVVGKYPVQENFCEALMCDCEDYILVERISNLTSQPTGDKQTKIEGQLDCLPHRDKTGGETTECTVGLRDIDNKYYILQGLNQEDLVSGKIGQGQKVIIIGILVVQQDSLYDTIGTLEVVSVERMNE